MADYYPSLKLDILTTTRLSTEQLLDTISRYNKETGILYYSWFSKQVQENNYLNDNIQRIVYGFAHNPVFTVADLQAENGTLLEVIISRYPTLARRLFILYSK